MIKLKKSQIFMLDFILAFVLLLISLALLFSYFSETRTNSEIYNLNRDLTNALTQTKVNDLNTPEIRKMFLEKKIENVENTIAQQIAEFWNSILYQSDTQNLTEIFVSDYLERKDNINITLWTTGGTFVTTLYNQSGTVSFEDSELASVNRRPIIGYLVGPSGSNYAYEIEVKIWN